MSTLLSGAFVEQQPSIGLEIDMISLGNADSLLVSKWNNGVVQRILLDAGNKSDTAKVTDFLKARGVTKLDHVVVTHPHDDHAGGMIDLVNNREFTIGKLWMHQPQKHISRQTIENALNQLGQSKIKKIINESLKTQSEIETACLQARIEIEEPFRDSYIGFLFVCGPTKDYYESLLQKFTDLKELHEFDTQIANYEQHLMIESIFDQTDSNDELGGAPVTPENNSATILFTKHAEQKFLFTSDAGPDALQQVVDKYNLTGLEWMQIPHHGSRRNLNETLIKTFSPKTAFVSADGTKKHPRRAVVNAFKKVGSKVFSTHYPSGGNIWHHQGVVPSRAEYTSLAPLYDAK
jgi:beta-lactamase superfamily II metal-dependent hydrolase